MTQEESMDNPLLFRDWELEDFRSPPSLSLLSAQEVSMATLHPGPLQPVWQTHCQLFWPSVHLPLPLHRSGQPSGWRNEEGKYKTCLFPLTLTRLTILLCKQKARLLLVGQTLCQPQSHSPGVCGEGGTLEKWGLNSGLKRSWGLPSATINVLWTL